MNFLLKIYPLLSILVLSSKLNAAAAHPDQNYEQRLKRNFHITSWKQFSALERALVDASAVASVEIIQELINKGVPVNFLDNGELAPIEVASQLGRTDVVRCLIANNAYVVSPDLQKQYACFDDVLRPLHYAAANGHNEVVEILIENGADIDAPWTDRSLPIDIALAYGQFSTASILERAKRDKDLAAELAEIRSRLRALNLQ